MFLKMWPIISWLLNTSPWLISGTRPLDREYLFYSNSANDSEQLLYGHWQLQFAEDRGENIRKWNFTSAQTFTNMNFGGGYKKVMQKHFSLLQKLGQHNTTFNLIKNMPYKICGQVLRLFNHKSSEITSRQV